MRAGGRPQGASSHHSWGVCPPSVRWSLEHVTVCGCKYKALDLAGTGSWLQKERAPPPTTPHWSLKGKAGGKASAAEWRLTKPRQETVQSFQDASQPGMQSLLCSGFLPALTPVSLQQVDPGFPSILVYVYYPCLKSPFLVCPLGKLKNHLLPIQN